MKTLPPRRWNLVAAINLLVAVIIRPSFSFPTARVSRRGRSLRPPAASSRSDHDTASPIHPSLSLLHSFTSHITHIDIPQNQRVQAYCLSDMHADGDNANIAWLEDKCRPTAADATVYSVLIVPGDMANSIPSIRRCFQVLTSNWDAVCYCVGNHEAWVKEKESTEEDLNDDNNDDDSNEEDDDTERTSIDQLVDVLTVAKEEGVHVGPVCVNYSQKDVDEHQSLWMVPLQSFYHSSWDTEPDLVHPALLAAEQRRSFRKRWNDYRNMKWPEELTTHTEFTKGDNGKGGSWALASAFSDLNHNILEQLGSAEDNNAILSFSHYVPRIELSIEKRFLIDPRLARVIGSDLLERDVRKLKPNLHLFGHTHIPIGMEVDDIRYAQWPLGYPKESTLQCRTVAATGPMLVFDSEMGGVPSRVVAEESHWSRHYHEFDRDPNNLEPAPWLMNRLERIGRSRR